MSVEINEIPDSELTLQNKRKKYQQDYQQDRKERMKLLKEAKDPDALKIRYSDKPIKDMTADEKRQYKRAAEQRRKVPSKFNKINYNGMTQDEKKYYKKGHRIRNPENLTLHERQEYQELASQLGEQINDSTHLDSAKKSDDFTEADLDSWLNFNPDSPIKGGFRKRKTKRQRRISRKKTYKR